MFPITRPHCSMVLALQRLILETFNLLHGRPLPLRTASPHRPAMQSGRRKSHSSCRPSGHAVPVAQEGALRQRPCAHKANPPVRSADLSRSRSETQPAKHHPPCLTHPTHPSGIQYHPATRAPQIRCPSTRRSDFMTIYDGIWNGHAKLDFTKLSNYDNAEI